MRLSPSGAPLRAPVSTTSLAAAAIACLVLTACGGSSKTTSSSPQTTASSSSSSSTGFTAKPFASGAPIALSTPSGTTSATQPDDITGLNGNIFVAFQNSVGTKGEPVPAGTAGTGYRDSTVVEFSSSGSPMAHWGVPGHADGLTANPATGRVIVTTNEDGNAHLFLIDPSSPQAVEYHVPTLPHGGGLDAITVWHGMMLISASAPSGTKGPAVYVVSLNPSNETAGVRGLFADNATASRANTGAGGTTHLALTDPDSNAVVPASAPRFGGQFELTSQGDLEQIFVGDPSGKQLSVLRLPQSVDDSAWPTSASGTLYVTEGGSDLIWKVTGPFRPGAEIASVSPCNANAAPTACPSPPKWGPNYLGQVDMSTGAITKISVGGQAIQPKGLFFVP